MLGAVGEIRPLFYGGKEWEEKRVAVAALLKSFLLINIMGGVVAGR